MADKRNSRHFHVLQNFEGRRWEEQIWLTAFEFLWPGPVRSRRDTDQTKAKKKKTKRAAQPNTQLARRN